MSAKAKCGKPTKKGTPCQNPPVKGKKHCIGHLSKKDKKALGFGGPQPGSGRPANPKPTEIMRRLVEEHVEVVLAPHFRTLGYDVERDEKTGELRIVASPDGGAKIYGESKEGDINMTSHDDLGAHIAAAEKLLDRIYGRPKQATELTGAEGGPVELVPVSREKAKEVGGILSKVGAGGGG